MDTSFPQCLWKVVLPLLEDLDVPRALTVRLLIEHGEFDQLVNLITDPAHHLTADSYFRSAVATELLRKNADLPTSIDRRQVAVDGFNAAEKQCYESNVRLDPFLHGGPFQDPRDLRIADVLQSVRLRIGKLLGKLPSDAFLDGRFGPGATFNDRGLRTSVPHKMSSSPTLTVTLSQSCFYGDWLLTKWKESVDESVNGLVTIVRGNRFVTVPKDATKDRGIAVEPSVNVFYQLALGKALRRRLRRCGIDLDDGQDQHRLMACAASRQGNMATIDLSSASDTVCRNLVKLLLPEDWFWALDMLRSPTTQLGGRTYRLEKFSSMGNGFTFELETLIFLSLAIEACRLCGVAPLPGTNVLVYGDDIILPSECADTLLALLRFCGFTPNGRKTFVSGAFRESCGGDFFDGVPVRAHYLKEYPNEPQQWIALANGLYRLASHYSSAGLPHSPFRRAWFRVLDNIPMPVRGCRGPSNLGDIVIHDREESWTIKKSNSIRYLRCLLPFKKPLPLERFGSASTVLAAALFRCPSTGVAIRGAPDGYRLRWVPFS